MNRRSLSIIALLLVIFAASAFYGKQRPPVAQFGGGYICGNSACEPGEGYILCPEDCPTECGNGYCDNYEVQQGGQYYCPQDCEVCPNGGTWPECQTCPYGQYGDWPNCSCENGGDPGNGCQLEEDPCADPNNPGCGYCGDNRCDESEQGGESKCGCPGDCGEPSPQEKAQCSCSYVPEEQRTDECIGKSGEWVGDKFCADECTFAQCANGGKDDDKDGPGESNENPTYVSLAKQDSRAGKDVGDGACIDWDSLASTGKLQYKYYSTEDSGDPYDNGGLPSLYEEQGVPENVTSEPVSLHEEQPGFFARVLGSLFATHFRVNKSLPDAFKKCADLGGIPLFVNNIEVEVASNKAPLTLKGAFCMQKNHLVDAYTQAKINRLATVSKETAGPVVSLCGEICHDVAMASAKPPMGMVAFGSPTHIYKEWCMSDCVCMGMNASIYIERQKLEDDTKTAQTNYETKKKELEAKIADPKLSVGERDTARTELSNLEAARKEELKKIATDKDELQKREDQSESVATTFQRCMTYGVAKKNDATSYNDSVCPSHDESCCRAYAIANTCPLPKRTFSKPTPISGSNTRPGGSGGGGGGGTIAGGSGGGGGTAGTGGGASSTLGGSTTGGATGGGGGGGPGGASGGGGGGSSVSSRVSSKISSSRLSSTGFSSSRISSVSTRSSAFSTSTSRSSIPLFQRSSSRSSRRSSFGAYSSYLQVLACPPDACALNNYAGNTFCARQGMACVSSNDLPCIRCVAGDFSSSSFGDIPFSASSAFAASSRPLQCGNGIIDAGEECDDGNLSNADSCTTACRRVAASSVAALSSSSKDLFALRFCGNGSLNEGEECDLGADNSDLPNASCRTDCSLSRCGDQIVDGVRGEQCDDGNATDGDGCSASCTIEQFAGNPSSAAVLPGSLIELPFVPGTPNQASVLPNVPAHGPVGDTGPEAVAIMAAGASAGYTWMKMRRTKK